MACFPSGSLSLLCSQAPPALTLPWVMQETWVVWSVSVSSPLGCSWSIMGSSAEAAAPSGETHLLCWGLSRRRDLLLSLLLLSPRGLQGHFSLFFPHPFLLRAEGHSCACHCLSSWTPLQHPPAPILIRIVLKIWVRCMNMITWTYTLVENTLLVQSFRKCRPYN